MYTTNKHRRIILCFVVYLFAVLVLFMMTGKAHAGWECYQQMVMTQEVSAQSASSSQSSGSSMYTSDGRLRKASASDTYNSTNNSNSTYHNTSVPHYFTICEESGRIVSIIEHN
jgi:preprotein translocase subunit SecF